MTKLIRKNQKVFAENANSNEIAVFGSLKAGIPTFSTDIDNIQSAEYLRGLFGAVIGDNSPAIEDHNSLFYLFSRQLAYLFQQGIAEWDSATEYHTGSLCSLSTEVGKIYVSRTDTNVNHSPTGTNWQLYWYVFDLNKLEKYTPFCVNNGNTDADGNGDLISFTGNILSFKIGGSYVNMGATTANGTHFDISSISDIDFASASNGTYYFYIQSDGTVSYYATALYIQRKAPITPATNDVWLDTSKELLTCYKWSGTAWAEVQFVPFVKVIKTGGVITAVSTFAFNVNGVGRKLVKSFQGITDWYNIFWQYDYNSHRIRKFIEQGGEDVTPANNWSSEKAVTFLIPMFDTNYYVNAATITNSAVFSGSVSTLSTTGMKVNTLNRASNSSAASTFRWEVKGYIS